MFPFRRSIQAVATLILALFGFFTLSCGAGEKMTRYPDEPAEKTGQGVSMRVLWTVSSYHLLRTATMGEAEARAMLFKPLDINSSTISFAGETCRGVVFTRETADAEKYLRERFRITPQELGVDGKTLTVVRTNCRIPGFDEYIRLQDGRLLVSLQGVLFVLLPNVNY